MSSINRINIEDNAWREQTATAPTSTNWMNTADFTPTSTSASATTRPPLFRISTGLSRHQLCRAVLSPIRPAPGQGAERPAQRGDDGEDSEELTERHSGTSSSGALPTGFRYSSTSPRMRARRPTRVLCTSL